MVYETVTWLKEKEKKSKIYIYIFMGFKFYAVELSEKEKFGLGGGDEGKKKGEIIIRIIRWILRVLF